MDRRKLVDLRVSTIKYFDLINFTELNDRWVDDVIENEFTDAEQNTMTISILFVQDAVWTLKKLADLCHSWCEITDENDGEVSNVSSSEEVLWNVLDEINISVKHILGIIYLLSYRAAKISASQDEKTLGLASANLYFNCLQVPGSGAYSVYHPNLFRLCVDCLPVPDITSDKDPASIKEFDKLSKSYISTLISLIPLLREFHLGTDSNTVEHTVKKLIEVTACEFQKKIEFDINFCKLIKKLHESKVNLKPSHIVSMLAYHALLALIDTDLNGDKDHNYGIILSYLNRHILCYKAKKSQTISQKHLIIKDSAVSFISHNLRTKEFCSEVTQTALKRLCLGVSDKADFRSHVSQAVITVLYGMRIEHMAEMIQWFLLLIDSADTKDRVFALDLLSNLLSNRYQVDSDSLSNSLKVYLTEIPIIFAILTRCDDVSPLVRTKALAVLSQNMECILNFLDKMKDQETFEVEVEEEFTDKDLEVNGNHRYFWYNMTSFRERLNEIASILHRRIEDNNVTARKAALIALENLMVFDLTYLSEENLKFFDFAAKDPNILVRKHIIQSLSVVLDSYKDNYNVQTCWLKCVLPLVQDAENSVQAKAISVLEEQFLQKVFSSSQADRECSFSLLKLLSTGDYLSHQRYLQKIFSTWKSENKLKSHALIQLEKYIETEWEECVWFYISHYACYCSVPSRIGNLCVVQFEKYQSSGTFPTFMEYLLKVLIHTLHHMASEKVYVIQRVMSNSMKSLSVPVEFIPVYVETLYRSHKHLKTEDDFSHLTTILLQKCVEHLSEIQSNHSFSEPLSEELLAKYFCIIKELCQLNSSLLTESVVSLLKMFTVSEAPPVALSKVLTPRLRAHAFAALGKICLQDEILAKDLLTFFATELMESKHDVIRNNVVIVLIEMCKRYTSFADRYVPLISLCFKDKLYLIRYQTIVLVVNLLQEGYIKWRGPLFFCLLSTLVDKKEAIQELGRYSLSQLLQDKKKTLFSEHFIDSIFVFNNFAPPDNETIALTVKELDRFAIKGDGRREERMLLYKFLLESMDVKERAYLVKSICEILMNIAEAVYSLDYTTESIIRDCFSILTCKEIRAFNVDQISEDIDEAIEKEFCKTELDTRKIVIIDPVVPVIVSLKNGITDPDGSDLLNDIILFLKELLHDFKDTLKDVLAIDKILLKQVELEIRNDAERERTEKRLEKDSREKNKHASSECPPERLPSCPLEGIKSMIHDVSNILDQDKKNETSRDPQSRHSRQQGIHKGDNRNTGASKSSSQSVSYNIVDATPSEVRDMRRFASSPRVVLTAVKIPPSSNICNLSAIEKLGRNVVLEDSDEDML